MKTAAVRACQLLAAMLALPAAAAPVDPPLQQELLGLYDAYNRSVTAGKLDAAMTLMSEQMRAHAKGYLKTEKDRREATAMARMTVPDSISVVHTFIDKTGTKARLVTVASKTMPKGQNIAGAPPPGTVVRNGMALGFAKEGGRWKFDEQLFTSDPTAVKGCKNEVADPRSSYDPGRHVSAGGPVVRVDFKPEYTLVVYSVVGEANCAFLPAQADLAKLRVDAAQLVPYALVSMKGIAHHTDPRKMLAEDVEVTPEE